MSSLDHNIQRGTEMKAKSAYSIRQYKDARSYSKIVGQGKLYSRKRALAVVRFLKKRGVDAFASKITVSGSSSLMN